MQPERLLMTITFPDGKSLDWAIRGMRQGRSGIFIIWLCRDYSRVVGIRLTQVTPTDCGFALALPGEVGWTICL